MWLIHEHSKWSNAVDKYWIFTTFKEALSEFYILIKEYEEDIDSDWLQECYSYEIETQHDLTIKQFKNNCMKPNGATCIHLKDGDYLVLTEIDTEGFGRRP